MKNKFFFINTIIKLVLVLILFSSCSKNGNNIEIVKLIPVKIGNDFGYIDREGKIIINPQFSEATVFRNGLALVKTSGNEPKWGFITEDGKFAISPTYKYATVFSEDLAWVVVENGAPTAINGKGEVKITLQNAEYVNIFKEGLAAYSVSDSTGTNSKIGFIDKDGKIKINPQFSQATLFVEGKCAVRNSEGKWGFIDKEGKIIINYQFDSADRFINSLAVVSYDGKFGIIDANGKYIINPQFGRMVSDGSLFIIEQDNKWGWCDKEGKIVINPQFEEAYMFNDNDLAPVKSGGKWGYIDHSGKIVINPQFESALPFNGNMAMAGSNEAGFIDKEGKYVINPQFKKISWDYFTFISNGFTTNSSVNTDYFDINMIIAKININEPEGLSLDCKWSDIIKKFNLTKNEYGNYSSVIFDNKRISNEANYSFVIYGDQNLDSKIREFDFNLILNGKGYQKSNEIRSAIEKTFIGYDLKEETAAYKVFTNSKNTVKIFWYNNTIRVEIYPNYINDYNGVAVDTIPVEVGY